MYSLSPFSFTSFPRRRESMRYVSVILDSRLRGNDRKNLRCFGNTFLLILLRLQTNKGCYFS